MRPTLYEVRYCHSSLFIEGIGAAIDAARSLSGDYDRAEIHADGALIAVYVHGEQRGVCCNAARVRGVWPQASADEVNAALRAAVARRDATGVSLPTAAWVEAVLARDATAESKVG
ncbi:MAG: hypothetical protein IT460_06890 [Planctomycetes bacterium]|nr:hypothetical protein [Planctomycetota bacterium]